MFPKSLIDEQCNAVSQIPGIISRDVIFGKHEPIQSQCMNVTDRQTGLVWKCRGKKNVLHLYV